MKNNVLFPAKANGNASGGHGHSHGINPDPTSSTSIRDFMAVLALSFHAVFEVVLSPHPINNFCPRVNISIDNIPENHELYAPILAITSNLNHENCETFGRAYFL